MILDSTARDISVIDLRCGDAMVRTGYCIVCISLPSSVSIARDIAEGIQKMK